MSDASRDLPFRKKRRASLHVVDATDASSSATVKNTEAFDVSASPSNAATNGNDGTTYKVYKTEFSSRDAAAKNLEGCKSKPKAPGWWKYLTILKHGEADLSLQCTQCNELFTISNPAARGASHFREISKGKWECNIKARKGMLLYMYVSMYACMYVYVQRFMYGCMAEHTYMFMYASMYACMYVHVHRFMYVRMCACTYVHVYVCVVVWLNKRM